MSALVRGACHVAVLLWIALYLAWRATEPVLPAQLAEPLELLPLPEAVVEPVAAERAEPEPLAIEGADLARGEELLLGGGPFPALSFSYQSFPSFRVYARAMEGLGARFVVVRRRAIVGGVDLERGALAEASVDARFSPRARDYSAEPALAPLTRSARERFGADAEIMMLVPLNLDAGLFGGIAGRLDDHARYSEVRGRYLRGPDGGVLLRLDSAHPTSGGATELDLVIDLGAIARSTT